MTRPEPSWTAPEGHRHEPRVDNQWRLTNGKRCRAGSSRYATACGAPSVAELNRGRRNWRLGKRTDSWWAYCAEHMFGRWIEDGHVMCWIAVEDEAAQ